MQHGDDTSQPDSVSHAPASPHALLVLCGECAAQLPPAVPGDA